MHTQRSTPRFLPTALATVLLACAAGAAWQGTAPAAHAAPPRVGAPAPAFELATAAGAETLAGHHGRWLVVLSFPPEPTPACGAELSALAAASAHFASLDTDLVGFTAATPEALAETARAMKEEHGLEAPIPLGSDADLRVARAFGLVGPDGAAPTVRATFVVDPHGVLRATSVYPTGVPRSTEELLRLVVALRTVDAGGAVSAGHELAMTEKLEPYECGDVKRIHTLHGFFLASQPAAADFEQAQMGGIKTVINQRHASENKEFDEREVVTGLGMTYHNPAFNGPAELTPAVLDETRALLRTSERPVLMHCASANRTGAVWFAYRVLDEGLGVEEALAEARTVGLRSPDYERIVREYIEKQQAGDSGRQ